MAAVQASGMPLAGGGLTAAEELQLLTVAKGEIDATLRAINEEPDKSTLFASDGGVDIYARFDEPCPKFRAVAQGNINIAAMRPHVLAHTRERLTNFFTTIDPMFKSGDLVHHFAPGYAPPTLPFLCMKWMAFSMPFPVWTRDFVIVEYSDFLTDVQGVPCAIVVCKSVDTRRVPSTSSAVRAELLSCSYVFRQVQANPPRCQVTMTAHADPKGSIPKWALRFSITQQATNLTRMMKWASEQPGAGDPFVVPPGTRPLQDVLGMTPQQLLDTARQAVGGGMVAPTAAPTAPPSLPSAPAAPASTASALPPALAAVKEALAAGTAASTQALSGAPLFARAYKGDTPPSASLGRLAPVRVPRRLIPGTLGACHVISPAAVAEVVSALAPSPTGSHSISTLIRLAGLLGVDPVGMVQEAVTARDALANGAQPPSALRLVVFQRPAAAETSVVRGSWQNAVAMACRAHPPLSPAFKRCLPVLTSVSFTTLQAQYRAAHPGLVAELVSWEGEEGGQSTGCLFTRLAASPFAAAGYAALTSGKGEEAAPFDVRYFLFLRMGLTASFTGGETGGALAPWLANCTTLALCEPGAPGGAPAPPSAGVHPTPAFALDYTRAAVAMLPPAGSMSDAALGRALVAAQAKGDGPQRLGDALWSVATGQAAEEHQDDKVRHWMASGAFIMGVVGMVTVGALYGGAAFDWATGKAGDATHWVVAKAEAVKRGQ